MDGMNIAKGSKFERQTRYRIMNNGYADTPDMQWMHKDIRKPSKLKIYTVLPNVQVFRNHTF